ncbi:MAG: acetamidase/formamidase family protein [Deltaproteobacteria bacterium]|jgi:acetamidase/formamidase|nr:acetamidase/formamidase family protein [Deltaproteobacteria bacterium]
MQNKAQDTVFVDRYTNGILGPKVEMLGPVKDGGYIVANTAPGCWGPMLTPGLRGGHEVTMPVIVEGAEVGDAIAIRILGVDVTSTVTASGNDAAIEGRFNGDPFVAGKCASCGALNPETKLVGIGAGAVRCVKCGAEASPFKFNNGYTIAFNEGRSVGVTLSKAGAEKAAHNAANCMRIPAHSIQHPVVALAPHDMPGMIARLCPFLGQIGTTPSADFPDSHNAGDFGQFLIGAPHEYAKDAAGLEHRTDGHMDVNMVRRGAILICPVKVPGGGVYVGDAHAMQGDGEIAGHTCDVAALATLRVHVIKKLAIDGPILLPLAEDLPMLARPFSECEYAAAEALAKEWGSPALEKTAPVSFVGTGATLNDAIANGLGRAAKVLQTSVEEIKNRCTINGAIRIGRAPGVVTVTFLAPVEKLKKLGIYAFVKEQYPCIAE